MTQKNHRTSALITIALSLFFCASHPVYAVDDDALHIPQIQWPSDGPLGRFDRAALQRGFQVYLEVCSACHSLRYLRYQDLEDIGYSKEDVAQIAGEFSVQDGPDDEGQMYQRKARGLDFFVEPFANEQAARAANGGAYPPDLSLITLSRRNADNYMVALLKGYREPPPGFSMVEGKYYNVHYPGRQIGMPPPLYNDIVTYEDGSLASIDQMSEDVTQFLIWAADPSMEERKRLGIQVFIFLLFLSILMVAAKKCIWSDKT